jgi:RimJ/RimL family protein N-acetyltransferase
MLPSPTERLILREATPDDAGFFLRLLTEPSWARFIRKHDVDTEVTARKYLQDRIIAAYGGGKGFWITALRESAEPIGICGIIKRDALELPDLGFALLEQYWGKGYAREASETTITYARESLGLAELLAISNPDNIRSHTLLARLGFVREGTTESPDGETSVNFRLALDRVTTGRSIR